LGLRFRVEDLGFGIQDLGFRVQCFQGLGFRVLRSGVRVQGSWFTVYIVGFRV
jgi:hypothetical protein